jgi:hypothetical protein
MIKTLKAPNSYQLRDKIDDYIEIGYRLKTAPYKCWWADGETKWRAKVEAPEGQLEARLEGQK